MDNGSAVRKIVFHEGDMPIVVPAGATVQISFKSEPNKHISLVLLFADLNAPVVVAVERDGRRELLGSDASGLGRRMLSIFDPGTPTQYMVDISTSGPSIECLFRIVRREFHDGSTCENDCAELLQLPLPVDPRIDGYRMTANTLFRYQFGRRDVIMFIRHVAR